MKYRSIRIAQIGDDPTVDFAVSELQRYLKQMDAQLIVDIMQTKAVDPAIEKTIWVGLDGCLDKKVPTVTNPKLDDAIVVDIVDGTGCITGSNPRSVLLGVYRFLRELGCRWVRPGKAGERIPLAEINCPSVAVCEVPSYRYRGVVMEGANHYENICDIVDYLPKVGMNAYYIQFFSPLIFFERWYKHEGNRSLPQKPITKTQILAMVEKAEAEIAKRDLCYAKVGHGWATEPFGLEATTWSTTCQYTVPTDLKHRIALVNGKRELWQNVPLNTNLCYSNPETRNIVTQAAARYCRDNTDVDVLSFVLADGVNNYCECEACRKKRPSDWYVMLLNELDEKLTAAGMDTKVSFATYMDTMWIPETERLRNPDRFVLAFCPITRIYGKNYDEFLTCEEPLPAFVHNKTVAPKSLALNLKQLRSWQEIFPGDGFLFDYHLMWAHLNDLGGEACAKNLAADMKALQQMGLNGMFSCQVQRAFFPTALPFWMMAATLWDQSCDEEAAAEDYYRAAFGADWKLVRTYLQHISDLMLTYEGPWNGTIEKKKGPFCKDYDALAAAVAEFVPVMERNLAQNHVCKTDWEVLKLHGVYVNLVLDTLRALKRDEMAAANTAIDKLLDWMCMNEMPLQKVLDVFNARRFWIKRLRMEAPGREWATPDA